MNRGLTFLIKSYRPLQGVSAVLVYTALAIGIASMVMLFRFSARIERTVNLDAQKFLAADFQVQARRKPTSKVNAAALSIAKGDSKNVLLQTDLLASVLLPSGDALTVSLRALENSAYPFYGTFRLTPSQNIDVLKKQSDGKYGVFVDASMRERGLRLGDEVAFGVVKGVVKAYIEEEPLSVASAFAVGPRFIIHQEALAESKLAEFGAYAFYSLLIKSSLKLTEAQKLLKSQASEPHWRLVSPERANQQTERVVSRLQSFLMLIAFAAFVLGGVGLFAIARFQILRNLSDWILFKALGLRRSDLIRFAAIWITLVATMAFIFGFLLGALFEEVLSGYAKEFLAIDLATVPFGTASLQAAVLAFGASIIALGLPLLQVISVSPNEAWSNSKSKSIDGSSKTESWIFLLLAAGLGALAVTGVIEKSWLVVLLWAGATWLGAICLKQMSQLISRRRTHVFGQYPYSWVHRSWSELRVLNYSIAAVVYLMVLVSVVAVTLRSQLSVGRADAAPRGVALGVLQNQKDSIRLPDGVSVKWVPTAQMRITSIKGEPVKMAEYDDRGVREDDQRSSFSLTREHVVSLRSALETNESLLEASFKDSLFSKKPVEGGGVRLSLERDFAKRIEARVGDVLTVNVAGVELSARVDSLRTVQWFRFQPSFFILINPEDLQGAPFSYVGLFTKVDNIRDLQRSLQSQFPNVAVIDSKAVADRLVTLIDRVILSISSLGVFVLVAAFWVFVAVLISRRSAFRQDLYLFRILGASAMALRRLSVEHFAFVMMATSLVSGVLAVLSAWGVAQFMLEIPMSWVAAGLAILGAVVLGLVFTAIGVLMSGPYTKWRREAEDFAWQPG